MATDGRGRFRRYEFKYLVDVDTAARFAAAVEPHVASDDYAGQQDAYAVHSLYYDTPDLRWYYEKIDGQKDRRKLRVRCYPDSDEGVHFIEVKRRRGELVSKVRVPIAGDRVADFLDRGDSARELLRDPEWADNAEFILKVLEDEYLQPKVHVMYRRRALVGTTVPGLRITFDGTIEASDEALETYPIARAETLERHPVLAPRITVLELKFNEQCPGFLFPILQELGLCQRRVSKYCLSMQRTDLRALARGV